jgi:hypothetical protein
MAYFRRLEISFYSNFFVRRDQKIPVIWFVANSGGILGLCMGFSMVTVRKIKWLVNAILYLL